MTKAGHTRDRIRSSSRKPEKHILSDADLAVYLRMRNQWNELYIESNLVELGVTTQKGYLDETNFWQARSS